MNERDAYVQKMKAKLDEWNAELDKLSAQAEAAEADAKLEYQDQIDELEKLRNQARQKLGEVESASDDAWADVRQGAEAALNEMNNAFSNALKRFK
ncbi:sll1863 family stress response protein [Methylohalobius crimeensis]|uniref:hypothetical protein n=1 Tax=Methylohalobius crimeensis TaxID=244365 RepID=UPI0003B32A33|nr:hypothetical protein [Methylohalobius crimeensis]